MIGYEQMEYANLTDVGVRRSHNQDSNAVVLAHDAAGWREQGHLFMVADGMGAHAVGELASEMAVKDIPLIYQKHASEGVLAALEKAFQETNGNIHQRGEKNPEFRNMGTTTTALVLRPEGAWIGHVGDSRVYRIRAGRIEQLSYDHSLVWETARRQHITPDEVHGVKTNVIVRSMGPEAIVNTDIEGPHPVRDGDIFLLCSDGLSGPLSDHEIGAVASVLPPEEACQFLIDLANLRGGPDNITVVIVSVGKVGKNTAPAKSGARGGRIPWPLGILFLGVVLAGGAVALTATGRPGGELAFVLAVLVIIAGIGALVFHQRREKQRQANEPRQPRTRVYRHSPCRIEPALLDKLVKLEATLVQRAREKQWELDWKAQQKHHAQAAALVAEGDLEAGFRAYCRAMRPLTVALSLRRNKEEVFQPHWDRTGDQGAPAE